MFLVAWGWLSGPGERFFFDRGALELEANADSVPEALGFGVELGFVGVEPGDGLIDVDGIAEPGFVDELVEDEGGGGGAVV